jgi:hypothetical protein
MFMWCSYGHLSQVSLYLRVLQAYQSAEGIYASGSELQKSHGDSISNTRISSNAFDAISTSNAIALCSPRCR